uniref:Uncharacterized protein n=1 Tax=Globodera pallida TaxID=36090 RepID=A0A183BW91_GLOPA
MRNSSTAPSIESSANPVPSTTNPTPAAHSCIQNSNYRPSQPRPVNSNSTLRSNASSAFYYSGGQRRRSRPFTYGFGVGGGRKSKESQTWIRCLTVIAYFCIVSLPALLLSYYYTRVWDPTYLNALIGNPQNFSDLAFLSAGTAKRTALLGKLVRS